MRSSENLVVRAGYEHRMDITSVAPQRSNGWRGELLLNDPHNGAAIFDFDILLTCQGTAPNLPVRLSCVHAVGAGGASNVYGASETAPSCKMGRVEVWNPRLERTGSAQAGGWGTICGHMIWVSSHESLCRPNASV